MLVIYLKVPFRAKMRIERPCFTCFYARIAISRKQYLAPKRLQMSAVVEEEGTRWQNTGVFTRICVEQRRPVVELYSAVLACRGDSPSNRIQITFPPSPSAEALCGHGTPPYGSTIILYGPLKAARSRDRSSEKCPRYRRNTNDWCKQGRALLTKHQMKQR